MNIRFTVLYFCVISACNFSCKSESENTTIALHGSTNVDISIINESLVGSLPDNEENRYYLSVVNNMLSFKKQHCKDYETYEHCFFSCEDSTIAIDPRIGGVCESPQGKEQDRCCPYEGMAIPLFNDYKSSICCLDTRHGCIASADAAEPGCPWQYFCFNGDPFYPGIPCFSGLCCGDNVSFCDWENFSLEMQAIFDLSCPLPRGINPYKEF